MESEEL
ncbi:putative glutaredoxin, partial [Vibrio parahaemolyticus V-223/04]